MRVVFVVNNFPPRVGGVENHVAALARELVSQGHEAVVHTLTDGPTGESVEDGVRVHRWREAFTIGGLLGFPTPSAAQGVVRAVRSSAADAVSVHTRFFPLTWLGVAAARSARLPVIHTEHGSDHVASDSPVIRWGSKLVDLTLGRASLRASDVVVGVSEEVVAFVRRLAGVEASVFHNAIEARAVDAVPARRHVVFVGRLVPGKGWEDFLRVVAEQESDVTAEILGDGPDMASLRAEVDRLGLADRVSVRGRVPLEEVFSALSGAVLVNPTRLSEGFQTTLLEALAVGARVVTYPVPGAALLAVDGAPVSVVSRDELSLAAAVHRELEAPTGAWPRERVDDWTWPTRARQYADLVAEVARRGHSKP